MNPNNRNELAHILAEIDGLLAELEDIAEDPRDDDRERALGLLVLMEPARQSAERLLSDEKPLEN